MKRAIMVPAVVLVLAGLLSSIGGAAVPSGKIEAFVSILPQAYFVERIGGEYIEAEVLVGPGQSPATYEPTPRQMARLGCSKVYFCIGVPFERGFLTKISKTYDQLEIIDTSVGIKPRYLAGSVHCYDEDEEKDHHGLRDPHVWLDPKAVKIQAGTICEVLSRIDPDHAGYFQDNADAFISDLDRLDAEIDQILKPLLGQKIYVFHPAFGYFAQSYGLEQTAVEVEGKEPSARQLSELINKARAENVKIIFVQPQYSKKNAKAIANAIGGAVVPINPLPKDYLQELETMALVIKNALSHE